MIIPKGGKKKIPSNNPIMLPIIPYREPPNLFVPKTGIAKSRIVIDPARIPQVIRNVVEKGGSDFSWSNSTAR
jgi:hypothetical protein